MAVKQYSKGEEIANAVTHGIGAILSIVVLTLLVVFSVFYGTVWHVVSCSIYGATLILMYTMSTLYHAFPDEKVKSIFKIFDHSAIYLLIAGTYTPFAFHMISMKHSVGWWIFGIIWGIALIGVGICTVPKANNNKLLSALIYLAMGWFIVFYLKDMSAFVSLATVIWLIIGGVLYSIGVPFYVLKKVPYFHSVFHLFVLLGSMAHSVAVFFLLFG